VPRIHSSAIVDPDCLLADDVEIGPYCVVGAGVELGPGVCLVAHVVVSGHARLGAGVRVFPFAAVGGAPQALSYRGGPSQVTIGEGTVLREHVTVNGGTSGAELVTRVGRRCLLMTAAHVAHDCDVGDDVVMANQVALGGHVVVGERAVIGGISAVHQHVRVGRGAMIGGMSGVDRDVIPYGLAYGDRAILRGLNLKGLRRRGVARAEITPLMRAFSVLFHDSAAPLAERVIVVERELGTHPLVRDVLGFLRSPSKRPLCRP
jgi:UDP-N-acetylglucosamine acyltransferase